MKSLRKLFIPASFRSFKNTGFCSVASLQNVPKEMTENEVPEIFIIIL
jgi:hypothetical protein